MQVLFVRLCSQLALHCQQQEQATALAWTCQQSKTAEMPKVKSVYRLAIDNKNERSYCSVTTYYKYCSIVSPNLYAEPLKTQHSLIHRVHILHVHLANDIVSSWEETHFHKETNEWHDQITFQRRLPFSTRDSHYHTAFWEILTTKTKPLKPNSILYATRTYSVPPTAAFCHCCLCHELFLLKQSQYMLPDDPASLESERLHFQKPLKLKVRWHSAETFVCPATAEKRQTNSA